MGLFGMRVNEALSWFILPMMFDIAFRPAEWRWGQTDIAANRAWDKSRGERRKGTPLSEFLSEMGDVPIELEGRHPYYTAWRCIGPDGSNPAQREGLDQAWSPKFTPDCAVSPLENLPRVKQLRGLHELDQRYVTNQSFWFESGRNLHSSQLDPLYGPGEWLAERYPDYATRPEDRAAIRDAWIDAVLAARGLDEQTDTNEFLRGMIRDTLCGRLKS